MQLIKKFNNENNQKNNNINLDLFGTGYQEKCIFSAKNSNKIQKYLLHKKPDYVSFLSAQSKNK